MNDVRCIEFPEEYSKLPLANFLPQWRKSVTYMEVTMTERGLLAPLSPKEEGALRRIAAGITMINFLPGPEVERLQQLELAEKNGRRVFLTEIGRKRIDEATASS